MFILNTKLQKSKTFILAIKSLHSYGLYRWRFLDKIFWYHAKSLTTEYTAASISLLKYYLNLVFFNVEMDKDLVLINIQLKKNIQSYQGLRLHLSLPAHGQRTRTNASTQRLLAGIPRKRHFVQWKNRRKFAPKEHKKFLKVKTDDWP